MRYGRLLLALLLIVSLFGLPQPGRACGPFSLTAVFTYRAHPDFPLEKFARGELGVIQPGYARSYLFVAYRHLAGAGLNPAEQKAVAELWDERLSRRWELADGVKEWLEARSKIGAVGPPPDIKVFRSDNKKDEYVEYLNCAPDAFATATRTLVERVQKFGTDSPESRAWVLAQDKVFANCAGGPEIPDAATADDPAIIRADRAYQIATANFYAGNFDEAQQLFTRIAADASSPWQKLALYLSARALVRKGTLGAGPGQVDKTALAEAEGVLMRVLNDQSQSAAHAAARRLLSFISFRLRPAERLHELAQAIVRRNAEATLKQDLNDYTLLLDKLIEGETSQSSATDDNQRLQSVQQRIAQDDVTDWLLTFQIVSDQARDHAIQRWERTQSLPWLIAALSKINAKHPQYAKLAAAAENVKPNSPAFLTARFHRARLLIEAGRYDEARRMLDALLARRATIPPSALNRMLNQRMTLAADLNEFLTFARRVPAGITYDMGGEEIPEDVEKDEQLKKFAGGYPLFDADAARVFNEELPLSLLRAAAGSDILPAHLRRAVALAAWTRAALLDDAATARELAPVVENLVPQMKEHLAAYLGAADDPTRKRAALYAILKLPGLRPYVDSGIGRETPLGETDSYRDNWWCAQGGKADQGSNEDAAATADEGTSIAPIFLDAAQRAAARRQTQALAALGTAPNYLAQQAVAWAQAAPADPRAPEALHLAVRATRYGCTDEQTGRFSKAAFQLLHKQYPGSTWAKQTKYWFK
jgi:hypothetical protein